MGAVATISATVTRGGSEISLSAVSDSSTAVIETKAIGQDEFVHYLDRIIYNVTDRKSQTNMTLEVYGSDDEDGPFVLLDTIQVSSEDPGYMDPPGQRFFKFRFVDGFVLERWRLHGFSIFGDVGGEEF